MDNGKLRIGVIFGGRSGEHEVSLMSARSVLSALDPSKYAVTQIGIDPQGTWLTGNDVLGALSSGQTSHLKRAAILPDPACNSLNVVKESGRVTVLEQLSRLEVVFPVLHGTFGEDGTLQGLLEMADLAYVGAGVLGSALGMDKAAFKDVMRAHNIPVLKSVLVLRSEIENELEAVLDRAESVASYPLFVKPANLGSSVGITKCHSRADLLEGLLEAARYDRRVLIERGINGREIEISVLGNDLPEASVPGEIIPAGEYYSYAAKYLDENSALLIPAPIPDGLAQRARQLAVEAYRATDGAGMARADFLLDKDSGELYLNEINTIPGFTKISMYPKLWEASGLPYPRLLDRLIELALARKADRDHTERRFRRQD